MTILSLRTDRPLAELAIYQDGRLVDELKWPADRRLAETIHLKIVALLKAAKLGLNDIKGLVIFKGPGSFTGLRIGFSVANALAYGLNLPIVACSDDNWQTEGIKQLESGHGQKLVLPNYGQPPHVTKPRK